MSPQLKAIVDKYGFSPEQLNTTAEVMDNAEVGTSWSGTDAQGKPFTITRSNVDGQLGYMVQY